MAAALDDGELNSVIGLIGQNLFCSTISANFHCLKNYI